MTGKNKKNAKIYTGKRGGKYYIRNGNKVYIGSSQRFGMDYAVPGVNGGLGQGYVSPGFM